MATETRRQLTTREDRADALKAAIIAYDAAEHAGWAHVESGHFRYHPGVCPGCTRAILRHMLDEERP